VFPTLGSFWGSKVQRTEAVPWDCDAGAQCRCVNGSMQVQVPRLVGEKYALIKGILQSLSALNHDTVVATGDWIGVSLWLRRASGDTSAAMAKARTTTTGSVATKSHLLRRSRGVLDFELGESDTEGGSRGTATKYHRAILPSPEVPLGDGFITPMSRSRASFGKPHNAPAPRPVPRVSGALSLGPRPRVRGPLSCFPPFGVLGPSLPPQRNAGRG